MNSLIYNNIIRFSPFLSLYQKEKEIAVFRSDLLGINEL